MPEHVIAHELEWPVAGVRAAWTCRFGGVSRPPFDTLNLSTNAGDEPEAVQDNRRRLQDLLHLPAQPVWLRQVHGREAVYCRDRADEPQADASWTDQSNVVLAVLTADCLPVLLSSPDGSIVAVAHGGWRGLACGVLESVVEAAGLQGGFHAWLGPCIRSPHYEVGDDVYRACCEQHALAESAFEAMERQGKWQLDLAALARQVLQSLGGQVVDSGLDTWDDAFFSYRQSHPTGRQACLIWKT